MQKVSDLFIRVGRATFFVILLVLSGFIIFGREFLLVWVGEGYEAVYWVAIIVMLPFSVDLAQNLGLCILQVKGQYGFRAKIYLLSALVFSEKSRPEHDKVLENYNWHHKFGSSSHRGCMFHQGNNLA